MAPPLHKIGLYLKKDSPEAMAMAEEFRRWGESRGLSIWTAADARSITAEAFPPELDLMLVFGGDGTLLALVQRMYPRLSPILGVNLGKLGFLTEVAAAEFYRVMEEVIQGHYTVEERLMLGAALGRGSEILMRRPALNDVVVTSTEARLISVDLFADGEFVNNFRGDGLIISTPTGSTGYSLAAGGPILHPAMPALLLTPICPHTLTFRSLVLPAATRLEVRLRGVQEAKLSVDGQQHYAFTLDDWIKVETLPERVRIIGNPGRSYFNLLRSKLNWGLG